MKDVFPCGRKNNLATAIDKGPSDPGQYVFFGTGPASAEKEIPQVAASKGVFPAVTLALTLTTFYLYGYTLNRITLFALIFSIGILVDDAIVVVENMVRHYRLP